MSRPAPTPVVRGPGPRVRGRRAARAGAAVLAALIGAVVVAASTGQLALARVTTGSMAPALPVGSLVVGRPVASGALRVGDVLTARIPGVGNVTHRVVALSVEHGRTVARTRGDANAAEDPWTTAPAAPGTTRVAAAVPHVGRVLGRGPGGVPLVALPLLVLLATWTGCRSLLRLLAEGP